MKWNLQHLKVFLNKVKKYQIQQVKILDNKFELFVNTLHSQAIDTSISSRNSNKHITNITTTNKSYNSLNNHQKSKNRKYLTISAPMIGTFYRASSPEISPFVNIFDHITYNQTVCIIEAMKLMNEIEAEVNGRIIDILVKDGEFVDCGQPLMIVEPTDDIKAKLKA
uniref:Biotin carboxyl carrier protein of acetyl-CoA carboxylase n=1 Tax=Hildenbrandia rivularis TaxID=135206 RepID=A0A1C9CF83_9FLOR|nr:acetyl-CoA carboxylase biotin carboxyl carrier protein [Hildenbrandia rivularis]AOM67068.1 acetyl-CoA carboxylase biotin carboxyl carrier protein [Hildenbrandia rivularis]